MTREENEYNEWKHRRSFGHKHLLEGYRDVIACYRGIAKEVGMELEFNGLRGAISDLLNASQA